MSLLDAIKNAKPADLADVRARMKELEGELSSLRLAEKVLAARLGEAPAKGPPGRPPGSKPGPPSKEQVEADRKRVAEFLCRVTGAKPFDVAQALGIRPTRLVKLIEDHPWFTRDGQLVRITPEGRQAAG